MMRMGFWVSAALICVAFCTRPASAQYSFGSSGNVVNPSVNTTAQATNKIATIPTQGTGFRLMDFLPKFGNYTNNQRQVIYTTFPDQNHMPGLSYMQSFNVQPLPVPK